VEGRVSVSRVSVKLEHHRWSVPFIAGTTGGWASGVWRTDTDTDTDKLGLVN
jgi:hypothetical protein